MAGSRPDRWKAAADRAQEFADHLVAALEELRDLQEEYQEWLDGLPENLESSPLGEKLEAVCDLDLDVDAIQEAADIELPLGYGRD